MLAANADAVLAQFVGHEAIRRGLALIPVDERENTAARTAGGDALEALCGNVAEVCGEIRDDQEVIFFRHAASLLIVGD